MDRKTKLLWIKSLQDTIDQYESEINEKVRHRIHLCPLCFTAKRISKERYLTDTVCQHCIHKDKTFGQGIACEHQKSYKNVMFTYPYYKGFFKKMVYRRSYLIKIRNKLINSLK